MHFLIDASLPRSAADLLRRLGDDATDARDAGMRNAPDDAIADFARRGLPAIDNVYDCVLRSQDFLSDTKFVAALGRDCG